MFEGHTAFMRHGPHLILPLSCSAAIAQIHSEARANFQTMTCADLGSGVVLPKLPIFTKPENRCENKDR
jgi:hypothetical protein